MVLRERRLEELERVAEEQAALRRIATLVAAGATEADLAAAVSSEVGGLFGAQGASVVRWDGDTIRVIGRWRADSVGTRPPGTVLSYGGDTLAARVVETAAPARIDGASELKTEFARQRWAELGFEASIGAPIMVDGKVWGVVSASRTEPGDVFLPGDERRLCDFAVLVAQAIVNAEVRGETAALVAEQTSLRGIATLVAAGSAPAEVFDGLLAEVATLFGAACVMLLQWQGVLDEVFVMAAWTAPGVAPVEPGALYHPDPGGPTLRVLETGVGCHGIESSRERGPVAVIAAPVIATRALFGALTAARAVADPFPAGAEVRLRSFADLAGQSIANDRAQTELRASRLRIVQTADESRRRLERNLHDGAQQRLVSVSLALRLVEQMLVGEQPTAHSVLREASHELSEAMRELRELARGLHPALLSTHGLGPALESVCARSPFPVEVTGVPDDRRLPGPVEATIYYVISESLANAARHASASSATVALSCSADEVTVEIADDGVGGASFEAGTGLRGLVDRVEALGGDLVVSSPRGAGTLIRAELPLREVTDVVPSLPQKPVADLSTMSTEVSWEPVFVLVSGEGTAGEEMVSLLGEEYGPTAEREGEWWRVTIRPIDQFRRGTIIYRVIQASRTLADRHPAATTYLVTEDGNRWKLPPPALG
jgi:signal transduction histidine kinase